MAFRVDLHDCLSGVEARIGLPQTLAEFRLIRGKLSHLSVLAVPVGLKRLEAGVEGGADRGSLRGPELSLQWRGRSRPCPSRLVTVTGGQSACNPQRGYWPGLLECAVERYMAVDWDSF